LLAAVLASLIGQQINAAVETSKVVRAKLEESYFRTLNLPRYAEMLNVIAVSPIQEVSAERSMLEYNAALKLYSDEVSHLVAVADLYEEDVSGDAEGLRNCSKKFFENTANYFITAHRLRAQNLTNTPFSPSQLNDLVAIRMECEAATTQLRKTIATAMKRHLSHWPI
jgi:DNA polymerase I-like protein with 3'-5' exonuclease and polymerase domains